MQTHSIKLTLQNIAEDRATILSQQLSQIISEEFLKPHLSSHDEINMNEPDTLQKLDELIQSHFKNQNIVRVVLYDEDSMITYSTLHKIIGSDASKNAYVRGALDGQIYSSVVDQVEFDDFDPGTSGLRGKIIETYIPFSFKFREKFVNGVVEIYQDMTGTEARINKLNRFFLYLVVLVSAFLYMLLILITAQIDKKRAALVRQLSGKNTELEHSEKELKKSEQKIEAIVRSVGEGIISIGEDSTILFVNKELCSIFGFTTEELIGQNLQILMPEEYRQACTEGLKKYLNGAPPKIIGKRVEIEGLHKSGKIFPIEIRIEETIEESSERFFTASIRDISDQKKAEENLRKLSQAMEQSPASVIITDLEGKIEYVNPKLTKLTGYRKEEIMGENPRLLKSGEKSSDEYKKLWETITSGKEWRGEFHNKKKNGELYWELASISGIKNENGKMTHFLAIKEDITERKRIENLLHDKTELIQLMQEITIAANEASTIDGAMKICLDNICSYTGWPVGHVYVPESAEKLIPTTIWHLDSPEQFETFRKITEITPFDIGVGLPGRVLASTKPAWIVNVTKDPNFPRAKLAKHINVKAAFAFPVLEGKKVVAVLEFFSREADEPDKSLLEAMSVFSTQLGRMTERKRAEEQLREAKETAEKASAELKEKVDRLERFMKTTMGRETRIIDLKTRVKELEAKLR